MRDSSPFEGKRVTVMGLGLFGGGSAVARYLAEAGARVLVTDLRGEELLRPALEELSDLDLEFVLGKHRPRDFINCDLVIANPAIAPSNPHLMNAFRAGVPISSEVALFLDACPARVVAITGTQGKSSTTNFLAQLLEEAGHRVHLGGNIGRSLLPELASMKHDDLCALELSSYQLESLPEQLQGDRGSSPIVAASILNIRTDHLERHGTREEYARAKLRLIECLRQDGTLLLPADGMPVGFSVPQDLEWIPVGGDDLRIEDHEFKIDTTTLGETAQLPQLPTFQRENVLVALGLAWAVGVSPEDLAAALPKLRGLPHRLDLVGTFGERQLWDNGVSTTPDSTISALECLPSGMAVLIGGKTKPLDLGPLMETLGRREAQVVLFGAASSDWALPFETAELSVRCAEGPEEALEVALGLESPGILFSPACSSFDAYPNFQARASAFLRHAERLGLETP